MIDEANDPAVGVGNKTTNSGEGPAIGDTEKRRELESERERLGGDGAIGTVESAEERGVVVEMNKITKQRRSRERKEIT